MAATNQFVNRTTNSANYTISGLVRRDKVGGIDPTVDLANVTNIVRPTVFSTQGSGAASYRSSSRKPSSKPFASASRGPTVSPYLNLFREDLNSGVQENYSSIVAPQLHQQGVNRQLQRSTQQVSRQLQLQSQALNRQVQQIAAQPAFNPQGSQLLYPTGHATAFRNYSRFYPTAR